MSSIWRIGLGGIAALTALPGTAFAQEEAEREVPFLVQWAPGEFIWTLFWFLLLFTLLVVFVWPHILKGLQDRDAKIREDLKQAEQARQEGEQSLAEYKRQLAEARKEAQQVVEQSRVEAERAGAEVRERTQREIIQMRQRAEQEIASAKEQAVSELFEQAATMATEVAGQILKREINADDQRELVEQSLNRLSRS